MKHFFRLAALAALLSSLPAHAQRGLDSVDGFVSGDFRLSNNYLWRGLSLSNNNFAVSHSLSYTFEFGAYIGYWASNVELINQQSLFDSGIEVDVFAGYKAGFDESGNYGLDFGIQHYYYDIDSDYNHNELYLNIILTDFTIAYYRSTEVSNSNYYEVSWTSGLGSDGLTTLSVSLGYAEYHGLVDPTEEFETYNYLVGLSFYFGAIGDFTIAYSGAFNNAEEYGLASVARNPRAARNRTVFSWGISF